MWSINSQTINQLNGVDYGLTWETSPIGTYVMPLATVNQPTPNVSYNLINKSSSYPVRGTFKVILAAYKVKPVQQSDTYTSLDYLSGGA